MKTRIVQVRDGYWRIHAKSRELGVKEQTALSTYLKKARFPHKIVAGKLCVPESVPWEKISGRLEQFYKDQAEIYPF